MNNELVIDVSSSGITIALLENKKIVELNKDDNNDQFAVADIYLGRVRKIMPHLNAAFVDIGHAKDAFIHYYDLGYNFESLNNFVIQNTSGGKTIDFTKARMAPMLEKEGKVTNFIKPGQAIMVQIVKEAISTKGPRLTSEVSLAGRNLVLIPFSDKISFSQKLTSNEEKKRLRKLIKAVLPNNYGVIVRTVAEGKSAEVLEDELLELIEKWEECCKKLKSFKKPIRLVQEISRASAILRDMLNGSFNNIYVNNVSVFDDIKEYVGSIAPEKEKIVKLYDGKIPIFDQYGVTKQIKGLFGKVVSLRNGAYLVIEHTEALHVIDVNSGIRMKSGDSQETHALEVNLIAAEEITRQLRMRDMGGIIVIDFIDMHDNENKQILHAKMSKFMEIDRAKHNILPLTKFGLMQITRQRVRPEMHINTNQKCPACNGSGNVSPSVVFDSQLQNQIDFFVKEKKCKIIVVRAHPYIAAYVSKGFPSLALKWSIKSKCWIKVVPDDSYNYLEFKLYDNSGVPLNE